MRTSLLPLMLLSACAVAPPHGPRSFAEPTDMSPANPLVEVFIDLVLVERIPPSTVPLACSPQTRLRVADRAVTLECWPGTTWGGRFSVELPPGAYTFHIDGAGFSGGVFDDEAGYDLELVVLDRAWPVQAYVESDGEQVEVVRL